MLDLAICKCPHCKKKGIGLLDKLLSSPVYPATCKLCDRKATTSAVVIYAILGISATFLAIAPAGLNETSYDTAATLAILTVISLKSIGPLAKYDL